MDENDINAFYNGTQTDGYKHFGCKLRGEKASFAVFAPRAKSVAVTGDFSGWQTVPLSCERGIWTGSASGVKKFDNYKYVIQTQDGRTLYKSDPYGVHGENGGSFASKIYDLSEIEFSDSEYMIAREKTDTYRAPVSIYEVHIGSWRKYADGNYFGYRKFADEAVGYVKEAGFTHIELMGIAEYPYDGSWGYQVTGYFAPTSRYGTPADFAYLVNKFHRAGIGVILDWVPGHFPKDAHGLYEFDGMPLYEPEDLVMREHKEWGTRCFDYGRTEVKSFLISNALYWLREYHIDGLRVDAVATMLYLDYARKEWHPNKYGGKENLEAIEFFRSLNTAVFSEFNNVMMIAEESTAWPLVTRPVSDGGLGFNYKWNMGWMNDTLDYAKTDPLFRSGKHNNLTFSMTYAFSENYILPISHDEIVHGKGSLLNKMPGDYDLKFAGFRNYLMNMFAHPGKKLLMMGCELGMFKEWDFASELDWVLLDYPAHKGALEFVTRLNELYKKHTPFYEIDDSWDGFSWLVPDDRNNNVIVYERRDGKGNRILCVFNFSPLEYKDYVFGCDEGKFIEILRSDALGFGFKPIEHVTEERASHGKQTSIKMNIPPMCGIYMSGKAVVKKDVAAKSADTRALTRKKGSGEKPKKKTARKKSESGKA